MTRILRLILSVLSLVSAAHLYAQEVRITELLSVNTAGLKDEDLTYQPWIELWNPSTTTKVTLTGWKLTHGAAQWTFPNAMEIPPGEYLVVFADSKNRVVMTAPLHTSFTLNAAGGGPLQLLRSDASVASTFTTYPALAANVSYGRDAAEIGQIGTYTSPTPGDANNYSGSGVAGHVLIALSSRAFTGTVNVSLTPETPVAGAFIRYTTNGTVPTSTTLPPYTIGTPIVISATTLLRARVFESGKLPGETDGAGYLLLDGTTAAFNTATPLIVVSTFGVSVPDTGDQPAFLWVWEPGGDGRSRFTNLPTLATRAAVDRRGSSTLGNAKTNFNLEARKARDDADRDVSLLGMPDGSDWVFHAPFFYDPSVLHNPLMYALSNSIGREAVRTRMAEVFVETTSGALTYSGFGSGDYFGLYNVMEKIRRGKDRVDIHKLDTYDNDAVGKTGGYIFKVDRQDAGDLGFSAGSQGFAYYYPKEVEIKSPQRDPQELYLSSYITSFYNALFSGTYANPVTGYGAWLDVPEAIDHHLLNVWAFNVDGLRLSGYLHKERGGKLLFGPVWDFDRALSSTDGRDSNPATWRSQSGDQGTDFFNYTWWSRLFTDANFYQRYIDRWVELRRGAFSATAVNALIDTLNGQLTTEGVNRDLSRWSNSKRSWLRPFTPFTNMPAGQDAEVQRVKDFLQQRANFFDSQWVSPVTFSHNGGNIVPGLSLTMTAVAGSTIRYTLDGSDPRPSGGGPAGAGVLTYTAPITINATTRVKARAYNATWTALIGSNNPPIISKWSGPTSARFSTDPLAASGNVAITEVNFHPLDPTAAELAVNPIFSAADFEFIELKNIGSTPVDLGSAQFTAGIVFTFTGDNALSLAPGAFVVVAANPAAFAVRYPGVAPVVGPWSGDLSNGGERLTLKAAGGATIVDFTYDDAWFPATDGFGPTLVIYDPLVANASLSNVPAWRSSVSALPGGSPGANEPNLAPLLTASFNLAGYVSGVALAGSATDDRLPDPPKTLSYAWSQLSGPGVTTFTPGNAVATTATFSLPGTYTLRLTASDSLLASVADGIVVAKDTPAAWLARHPGIGALNDDFDGDGRSNLVEFAFGTDPSAPNGGEPPTAVIEIGHLTLTYTRIKPPSGVAYDIEVADEPGAFRPSNAGEITEQILADDGVTQTVKATDTVAVGAPGGRFMRLKISAVQ